MLRRDRYKVDPEYRQKLLIKNRIANRNNHRKTLGKTEIPDKIPHVKRVLKILQSGKHHGMGKALRIFRQGCEPSLQIGYSVKDVAAILGGYHHQVIYRWIREQKFPSPPYGVVGNRALHVYSESQIARILEAYIQHMDGILYLRDDNRPAVESFFNAVALN